MFFFLLIFIWMRKRKGCIRHHFKDEPTQRLHSYVKMESCINSPQACPASTFQWHFPWLAFHSTNHTQQSLFLLFQWHCPAFPSPYHSPPPCQPSSQNGRLFDRKKRISPQKKHRKRYSRGWRLYQRSKKNKTTPKKQPTQGVVDWDI